jgi:hypothetical protein
VFVDFGLVVRSASRSVADRGCFCVFPSMLAGLGVPYSGCALTPFFSFTSPPPGAEVFGALVPAVLRARWQLIDSDEQFRALRGEREWLG